MKKLREKLIPFIFRLSIDEKEKLLMKSAQETQRTGRRITMQDVLREMIQKLKINGISNV